MMMMYETIAESQTQENAKQCHTFIFGCSQDAHSKFHTDPHGIESLPLKNM